MKGYVNPTREERLRHIAATLARAYGAEPVNVPTDMREQVRALKDEPAPKPWTKPRTEVSPG